jgi:hypothetical protein
LNSKSYHRFIDVGAAEGYYAVGMTKYVFADDIEVIAYEAEKKGRALLKKLASLNGVNKIDIRGFCSTDDLGSCLDGRPAFLLMDVEGAEYELLDTSQVDFSNTDILVEVHGVEDPNAISKMKAGFEDSHEITIVRPGNKRLPEWIDVHEKIVNNANYVVDEFRGSSVHWLFLKSKK